MKAYITQTLIIENDKLVTDKVVKHGISLPMLFILILKDCLQAIDNLFFKD